MRSSPECTKYLAEETILKGLCEAGVDVTIQMVPEDNPVNVEKVL